MDGQCALAKAVIGPTYHRQDRTHPTSRRAESRVPRQGDSAVGQLPAAAALGGASDAVSAV